MDVTGSQVGAALVARIPEPEEAAVARQATNSTPNASIEPRSTMLPSESRAAWEAYDRATSPISSSLYYDVYLPVKARIEDQPQVYLDSDHNPQVSVAHRDYSESMAAVLGQVVLMVAPMLEPGAGTAAGQEGTRTGALGPAARVAELRQSIPAAQRGRITMGVGLAEDANGARRALVATSEPRGYIRPGVQLAPGETLIPGAGHAEANIVNYAQQNGLRLIEVGATRPICANCATAIEGAGARAVTPLKEVP